MIDHTFQDDFQSHYGRKLLQTNSSSSSFDTSQPPFIALLCIISILTFAFVMTVIILCYRYYSHRERKLKTQYKHRNQLERILSIQNNPPSTGPISITPTSASSYSARSSDHLFSNEHRQTLSITTVPSHRLQQSILNAYLNDLNSSQPAIIDVNKLKSYLFIDLHSTSSETFPDNTSKQLIDNTMTSGYNTSIEDENQRKPRYYLKQHQRRRSTLTLKRSHDPRFLMRERSLPNNLYKLPQLRRVITHQQRHLFGIDDTNNSSTTIQDLQSTNLSTTTDDYDDSHAYNVKQNQIMQTIKEDKSVIVQRQQYFPPSSFYYEQEPYFFEIVSTSRDDYSDIQMPYSPMIGNRIAYINDSIIV